ncbi:hypothetical protein QQS21_005249 [Conoideocrella luteorostrata]|uniref:Uncharacterized protein n=1 Tax=Conoideocrella luteorostrata TaxID=1105319 RepID=A0AAJ0FZ96_9HYPO|nr:hypothetical protein QQS21_005249 [Conoideocrella luteorostrata]
MASLVLTLSYVSDWIILIVFAAVGYVVGNISPSKHPFSIDNPDINFPYKGYDTASITVVFVVAVGAPAVIFVLSLLLAPGSTFTDAATSKHVAWRRKLWEWHAGWPGLALSVMVSWFFTSALRNVLSKPRPNPSRCKPDVANVAKYIVSEPTSGYGRLVSIGICTNQNKSVIDEAF